MLHVIKSVILSLVMVVGLASSSYAQKFPTFGEENDMFELFDAMLNSSGVDKEVTLHKTKYKLNVSADAFGKLITALHFSFISDFTQGLATTPKAVAVPFIRFYREGLEKKGKFSKKLLANAVVDTNPTSTKTFKDVSDAVTLIETDYKTLTKDELKDLGVLMHVENNAVITKKSLSADKKTQTYQVDIGGTLGTFTLTAV